MARLLNASLLSAVFCVGLCMAATVSETDNSPIFAASVAQRLAAIGEAIPAIKIRIPISEQAREHIAVKVRENAVPAVPSPTAQLTAATTETIVMAPYVLDAMPVAVEIPPPKSRFVQAVKSGKLFRHTGKKVTTEVNSLGQVGPSNYGRITFGFSFSW